MQCLLRGCRAHAALVALLLAAASLVDSSASMLRSIQKSVDLPAQHRRNLARQQPRYTLISVIGERNSGTNFIRKLLEKNLDSSHFVLEKVTQHKHYMQTPLPEPRPYQLVIVCVRNAYDWILSLQYKCYCCNKREREDFWRFVSAPYVATEYAPNDPLCPNEDLDISNGNQRFKNLLDMRMKKIQNHLNLSQVTGGVDMVRLEDVTTSDASLAWLQQYVQKYGLRLRDQRLVPAAAPCAAATNCTGRHRHRRAQGKLRAIEGDARPWHAHRSTDAAARVRASVYLNRDRLNIPGSPHYQYRDKVSIINAMIDEQFERSIGYSPVVVTYPPQGYTTSPWEHRRQRNRWRQLA